MRKLSSLLLLSLLLPEASPAEPAFPRRVISTAPSVTEMLFALGAGERVAGVTTYCSFPPEALTKPKIGAYLSPSLETILALRADLVVVTPEQGELLANLRAMRAPVLQLEALSLADIFQSIDRLAASLGLLEEGRRLVNRLRGQIDTIRHGVSGLPRRRVLFVIGRRSGTLGDIRVAARGSYIDELLQLAGGANIFEDVAGIYPLISLEDILRRDPEIIFDLSHGEGMTDRAAESIRALWYQFPSLSGARNRRVVVLTSDSYVTPGPRVVEALQGLVEGIHGKALP